MPSPIGTSTRPTRTRCLSAAWARSTTHRRSRACSARSGRSSGRRSCGCGWRSSSATSSGSAGAATGSSGCWRFPPVALELYEGNIHLWIAAAIALGFRYPWTWGFVLLTKVTPGVGLLWFAVRREWRALAIALGVTGVIVAVSLVLEGQLWVDWLAFIGSTPEGGSVAQFQIPIPLWMRLPAAAALVVWGALTDRRWTVVVAATLALPVLWVSGFAICAALASEPLRTRRELAPVPVD